LVLATDIIVTTVFATRHHPFKEIAGQLVIEKIDIILTGPSAQIPGERNSLFMG
jgi:hypothetical protein